MPGSHLMRFQHGDACAVELTTELEDGIPERGMVTAYPCAGEREHEEEFGEGVKFVATVQTEQLQESLYRATYDELVAFGRAKDALLHEWADAEGGRCASILDLQRYRREVHADAYHLLAQGGVVLRSQTIFEHGVE